MLNPFLTKICECPSPTLLIETVPRPVYNRCNSFTSSIMHDPAAALVKLYLSGLKCLFFFFFFFFQLWNSCLIFWFSEIWLSVAILGGEREGGRGCPAVCSW